MNATLGALRKLEEEEGLDIVGVTVGCESVRALWFDLIFLDPPPIRSELSI